MKQLVSDEKDLMLALVIRAEGAHFEQPLS